MTLFMMTSSESLSMVRNFFFTPSLKPTISTSPSHCRLQVPDPRIAFKDSRLLIGRLFILIGYILCFAIMSSSFWPHVAV